MLKAIIIGNIGQDAVIKEFGTAKYISFSVAHTESYKDKNGEKIEKTQWVSCLKHGESAVLQYLKKGTKVYVEGDLSVKTFDVSGSTQVAVNCQVSRIELIGGAKQEQHAPSQTQQANNSVVHSIDLTPTESDDLPF